MRSFLEGSFQMIEDQKPVILSIVIPTKNRQKYALAAVESVLRLDVSDCEIELIIRDCSDDESLRELLINKFCGDRKYNYIYDPSKPSMTENWDLAFSQASGVYVCGIGDDDAVLGNICDVVKYMIKNNIDCMRQPIVSYFWPGAYLGSHSSEKVLIPKNMKGQVSLVDIGKSFDAKVASCGFGYTHEMPNVYHAIIKGSILREHKVASGRIFNGTSIDAYSSYAFAKYTRTLAVVDFPFSIHGACPTSNTNRIVQKDKSVYKLHFDEFTDMKMPDFLPKLLTSEVSITESTVAALKDTGRESYVDTMNLAYVYGKSAALYPLMILSLYSDYRKFQRPDTFTFGFFSAFRYFFLQRIKGSLINSGISLISKYIPGLLDPLLKRVGNSNRVHCACIKEACLEIEQALPSTILDVNNFSPNAPRL